MHVFVCILSVQQSQLACLSCTFVLMTQLMSPTPCRLQRLSFEFKEPTVPAVPAKSLIEKPKSPTLPCAKFPTDVPLSFVCQISSPCQLEFRQFPSKNQSEKICNGLWQNLKVKMREMSHRFDRHTKARVNLHLRGSSFPRNALPPID